MSIATYSAVTTNYDIDLYQIFSRLCAEPFVFHLYSHFMRMTAFSAVMSYYNCDLGQISDCQRKYTF